MEDAVEEEPSDDFVSVTVTLPFSGLANASTFPLVLLMMASVVIS